VQVGYLSKSFLPDQHSVEMRFKLVAFIAEPNEHAVASAVVRNRAAPLDQHVVDGAQRVAHHCEANLEERNSHLFYYFYKMTFPFIQKVALSPRENSKTPPASSFGYHENNQSVSHLIEAQQLQVNRWMTSGISERYDKSVKPIIPGFALEARNLRQKTPLPSKKSSRKKKQKNSSSPPSHSTPINKSKEKTGKTGKTGSSKYTEYFEIVLKQLDKKFPSPKEQNRLMSYSPP
jgi:hypothetical protein